MKDATVLITNHMHLVLTLYVAVHRGLSLMNKNFDIWYPTWPWAQWELFLQVSGVQNMKILHCNQLQPSTQSQFKTMVTHTQSVCKKNSPRSNWQPPLEQQKTYYINVFTGWVVLVGVLLSQICSNLQKISLKCAHDREVNQRTTRDLAMILSWWMRS